MKTSTEILVGLQEKPTNILDWLPVISIISALIISLVAFIILCKRRIDHHRHSIQSYKKQQINRNNNQKSLSLIDVAECIDENFQFTSGLTVLLSKGNIILDDYDNIEMLNSMNSFDRLQYFQNFVFNLQENN